MVSVDHFDRGKAFYPLVVNYLISLHGFKELAARGIALTISQDRLQELKEKAHAGEIGSIVDELLGESLPIDRKEIIEKMLSHPPVDYLPPLDLNILSEKSTVHIESSQLAREIAENHNYLVRYILRSAASLLILAYEMTRPFHDKGPLWEFLRHCRNAAAHNGRLNIRLKEGVKGLPNPAIWRGFEITPSMHGSLLFYTPEEPGLLGPGDPIRLLWDIEQAYPDMTAIT